MLNFGTNRTYCFWEIAVERFLQGPRNLFFKWRGAQPIKKNESVASEARRVNRSGLPEGEEPPEAQRI